MTVVFATIFCAVLVTTLPLNSPLLASYDYINPNVNVIVLEAGPSDDGEDIVEIPGFIGHDIGGRYDWNLSTVPQSFLDGNTRTIPQGRALGGGTLLNGMLWNRGGQEDYDDWVQLGNPSWSWNDLLPYFKASETYTPVASPAIADQFAIHENASVHGFNGPVSVSYPHYFWNTSANFFAGLNQLDVPTAFDPNDGTVAGASFLPFDLDPVTQTRCTAKRAYYDTISLRPNLWISTGQTVTQLLFDQNSTNQNASSPSSTNSLGQGNTPQSAGNIFGGGSTLNVTDTTAQNVNQTAAAIPHLLRKWMDSFARIFTRQSPTNLVKVIGVEFADSASSPRATLMASREVIVAAGAIHTPQLLMLSGIGAAASLQALNITTLLDLPGVGSNLQDHMQVACWYPYHNTSYQYPNQLSTDQNFVDQAWTEYWTAATGPLTSGAIDGVAFPSLPSTTSTYQDIIQLATTQSSSFFLPFSIPPTVAAGYSQQQTLLTKALGDVNRAAFEIINANDGDLTVANMRPFSRGTVSLATTDPFTPPLIDPRYGSNPIDMMVLQAAIAFNHRLIATPSMALLDLDEVSPPANATSDDLLQYIRRMGMTEYHVSGTAAMMPKALGGVVDPNLLVYGTSNLRVVDASIFPLIPAGHLQAIIYGVAEKASLDIVAWDDCADKHQAADIIQSANPDRSASQPVSILNTASVSGSSISASPAAMSSPLLTSKSIVGLVTTVAKLPTTTSSPLTPSKYSILWTTFVTVYTTWI